ncbi:MAG TPA: hypothetical protein VFR08_15420, partial [Candidatus Angelobacter sp.]|nr:hypothetical protein [Candidatus Angelobacter sp.]
MSRNESEARAADPLVDAYSGYKGLPPLAGLHTIREAVTVGLSVTDSVTRLKRLHWSFRRLHEIFVARITSMPIYEIKMAFSLHAYYCAENVESMSSRVREMRQPPYGLEVSPDAALEALFDEVLAAPTTESLVLGLYEIAVPAVTRALENMVRDTNRLFDHISYHICRLALVGWRDVEQYGREAVRCLVDEEHRNELKDWSADLQAMLEASGDLDGSQEPSGKDVRRRFSLTPYKYD